eukprot:COSAG02_NODE_60_length_43475_cov_59.494582_8_plen_144_part_00
MLQCAVTLSRRTCRYLPAVPAEPEIEWGAEDPFDRDQVAYRDGIMGNRSFIKPSLTLIIPRQVAKCSWERTHLHNCVFTDRSAAGGGGWTAGGALRCPLAILAQSNVNAEALIVNAEALNAPPSVSYVDVAHRAGGPGCQGRA